MRTSASTRIRARKPASRVMRIAAVQMKFAPDITGNLARIDQAVAAAARSRVDAVLLPECATTGYGYDFSRFTLASTKAIHEHLKGSAARYRINLLVGSPDIVRGKRQNCLLVFDRAGRLVHRYAKCQLTSSDRRYFSPGNSVSLFKLDGVCCTAIICHERRYPELVRLGVMAGAQIVFHPNAGMDALRVSRTKRHGRDGIAVRAFENAVYYVFANSVGPQLGGLWSAGDSKIVAPSGRVLKLADNRSATMIVADLDLRLATRKYAEDSLEHPAFLARHWRRMIADLRRRAD